MGQNDRELFGKALLEAMDARYTKELSQCDENADCSEEHRRNMHRIVSLGEAKAVPSKSPKRPAAKKFGKRHLAIIVVAAVLLILTLTVAATRNSFSKAAHSFRGDKICIKYNTDHIANVKKEIEERYVLTFVPEGYQLTETTGQRNRVSYQFENAQGDLFVFDQRTLGITTYLVGVQNCDFFIREYGGYQLYTFFCEDSTQCIWRNEAYEFGIWASVPLSEDLLNDMIESVTREDLCRESICK